MGEYAIVDEHEVKLGVCEDLYYTRLSQATGLVTLDGEAVDNPTSGYRFRFPFPDEDHIQLGAFPDFERGVLLPFASKPTDAWVNVEPEQHRRSLYLRVPLYNGKEYGDSTYFRTVEVACPVAQGEIENIPVEIIQQRLMGDGHLAVIVRCGFCGSIYRLTPAETRAMCEAITARVPVLTEFWAKMLQRLLP